MHLHVIRIQVDIYTVVLQVSVNYIPWRSVSHSYFPL